MVEFNVFVLLASHPDTGNLTPVGVEEDHRNLVKLRDSAIDNLRLADFAASDKQKAKTEATIASMIILPAKLSFDA